MLRNSAPALGFGPQPTGGNLWITCCAIVRGMLHVHRPGSVVVASSANSPARAGLRDRVTHRFSPACEVALPGFNSIGIMTFFAAQPSYAQPMTCASKMTMMSCAYFNTKTRTSLERTRTQIVSLVDSSRRIR